MREVPISLDEYLKHGLRPDVRVGRNSPYLGEAFNVKVGEYGLEPVIIPGNLTLPAGVAVSWPFPQLILTSRGALLLTATKAYLSNAGNRADAPGFTELFSLAATPLTQFHFADFGGYFIATAPDPNGNGVAVIFDYSVDTKTWAWRTATRVTDSSIINTVCNFRQTLISGFKDEVRWSAPGALGSIAPDDPYVELMSSRSGMSPTTVISGTRIGHTGLDTAAYPGYVEDVDGIYGETYIVKANGACGQGHILVTMADYTVWACGYGGSGQLGQDAVTDSYTLVKVKGVGGAGFLADIVAVAAAGDLSVAATSAGAVFAWGYDTHGQCGQGSDGGTYRTPVQVKDAPGTGFLANITKIVSSGSLSACTLALDSDGHLWAWGHGFYGQCGQNDNVNHNLPVQVRNFDNSDVIEGIVDIWGGGNHIFFALDSSGNLWGWGYNQAGELALGNTTITRLPALVKASAVVYLTDVVEVASGYDYLNANKGHSVFRKSDGSVWCVGDNSHGQCGDNTIVNRAYPVRVLGVGGTGYLLNILRISASFNESFAASANRVYGWGYNRYGDFGQGNTTEVHTPIAIHNVVGSPGFITAVVDIFANQNYGFHMIKDDGRLYGVGENANGRLGDGTVTDRTLPVLVDFVAGVTKTYLTTYPGEISTGGVYLAANQNNVVFKVLPMEPVNGFIAYTSFGIYGFVSKGAPTPTFGRIDISKGVGSAGWHCSQSNDNNTLHIWIDHYGDLWYIDSKMEAKKLGFKEFILPMMAASSAAKRWYPDLVITYSKRMEGFLISNGTTCYLLSKKGMSQIGINPTSLASWHDIGATAATSVPGTEHEMGIFSAMTDLEARVETVISDLGTKGIKTIHSLIVGLSSSEAYAAVASRYRLKDSFTNSRWKRIHSRGTVNPGVTGTEFKLKLKTADYTTFDLDTWSAVLKVIRSYDSLVNKGRARGPINA